MEIVAAVFITACISYGLGYYRGLKEAEQIMREAMWRASKQVSKQAFDELTTATKVSYKDLNHE